MKESIRKIYKYIAPITILSLFIVHSYSVQSELQQKEEQTYISLKEFSELVENARGIELPFWDKAMFIFMDWILPVSFINKNETLKLLTNHKNEIVKKKKMYVSAGKEAEVVLTKKLTFQGLNINESKSIPMGAIFTAFVIAPYHSPDKPNHLRFKLNINSISCTAIADSILKADYKSGTIAAKITSVNCSNDYSKSIPLEAVALVSSLVLT